jgi:murein DD-endopeptidase MepM/ murein hydrolase activator NlpD
MTMNSYGLPVPKAAITAIVKENESHTGIYEGSVDFAVPLDTVVLAAADGIITRVRDNSDKYGTDPSFGQLVNYITIEHPGDELSEYLHLAKGSALVQPGQRVKASQPIAKTGLSGWLYAPHLHFMVYDKTDTRNQFRCLDVQFAKGIVK